MVDASPDILQDTISSHTQELARQLLSRNCYMATAESCTGGWIAQSLTALAGSSAWFDCGFITYSNSAKQRMLQVPASYFEADGAGAVSEATVLAMTAGAIAGSQAEVAVAVSGIAGPDGGSAEKPVGTVWIGWQLGQQADAQCFVFPGDREQVRLATVEAALAGLLQRLTKEN